MEFVQFHPTALDTPENPLALISEAVRWRGRDSRATTERVASCRKCMPTRSSRRATFVARCDLPRAEASIASISMRRKLGCGFAKRFPGIFALCAHEASIP
jgi:L-aspartate oxidase